MTENAAASKVNLAGDAEGPPVKATTNPDAAAPTAATKARYVHKAGEVNISAYFPAEMKASLRMVQAKTGNNVKKCLTEALCDLFKKHNVPVPVNPGKDHRSRSR